MSGVETELDQMYGVAYDWEVDVLDDLLRRAGLRWEHSGCWTNRADDAACGRCGRPRDEVESDDFDDEVDTPDDYEEVETP